MLQSIRDRIQSWVVIAIIGLLCVAFALWGIQNYLNRGSGNKTVVAKVNGQEITSDQINAAYQRLRNQRAMQLGGNFSLTQAESIALKKQALQNIVTSTVLAKSAYEQGFRISEQQIEAALQQIPAFQINGKFSQLRFQEILSRMMYSQPQFINDLRIALLENQVQAGYQASNFALPNEITQTAKLVGQTRDFAYLVLPASHFTQDIKITPAELKLYYRTHRDEFKIPEMVSVHYLKLSIPNLMAKMSFSTAQLKNYYQNNLSNFTRPARFKVAHILIAVPTSADPNTVARAKTKIDSIAKQLAAGGNFAQLAKQHSMDTATAKQGGVMAWLTAASMGTKFRQAVMDLTKPGQISPPIKTANGFEIIKLIAKQQAKVKPFSQVRETVRNNLAQHKAEQLFADQSDQLANITFSQPNSLAPAAKALDLTVKSTGFFTQDGSKTGIAANPKVVAAAFSSDVLDDKNNSNVINIDAKTAVVIRLKEFKQAGVKSFDQVKGQIQKELQVKLAKAKAKAFGSALLKDLQEGKSIATALTQSGVSWHTQAHAGRNVAAVNPLIRTKAFQLPHPKQGQPSLTGFVMPNGDYVIVKVSAVYPGKLTNHLTGRNANQRIFAERIAQQLGQEDYNLYIKSQMKKAKIKYEDTAMLS